MKILKWIIQIIVTLAFIAAGFMKLTTPYSELVEIESMLWVNDFSEMQVKIIGLLEVLGALGMILPMLLKRYQFFVPAAALGLSVTMIGAMIIHLMRSESVVFNIVLLALSLLVFWWRKDLFKKEA